MSTYDVRNQSSSPITRITFASTDPVIAVALNIQQYSGSSEGIKITDEYDEFVVIKRGGAGDLIKALQKAKELGWV